jgi:hypothetical protein
MNSVLDRIFYSQNEDEKPRDPNDPTNMPYFKATYGIETQAFARWVSDCGGEFLLKNLERGLISKIQQMITQDTKTIEGILTLVEIRKEVEASARLIDVILSAFEEEQNKS